MRIMEFLCKRGITANMKAANKEEAIKELVNLLIDAGEVEKKDRNKLLDLLMAREELGSTAIGQNVGIPHAKSDCVKRMVAVLGISQKGVEFNSLDGEPVHIFFLLVAPRDSAGPHLKALAKISRLLKDKYTRESLKHSKDEKTIINILNREDVKKI